ncbi:MAG: hypothetical protein ACU83N_05195 [Gammaproteobacteria bacterium]
MKAQFNNRRKNIVDRVFYEFNGHSIYGLEFIMDELYENIRHEVVKKDTDNVDWFGLSDLSI